MTKSALNNFDPLIARWFAKSVGTPTDVQRQSWPEIAAGRHVLVTAPTGSGKTLTAFLWAINQLISGTWELGQTRVLYISPLKALNNDIRRNLLLPLEQLEAVFKNQETPFPLINVQTRSGDTSQSDRRRMLRHPPEILITTPESLNLLLSSAGGLSILGGIKTVILDEIHAVVGNKRGVHLMTGVDRLVDYTGEFQRIALSATVRPMQTVADFVGGLTMTGPATAPKYRPRTVKIIKSKTPKTYQINVRFPEAASKNATGESFWKPLVADFKEIVGKNKSTLLFANSRRLCEKLTLKINRGEDQTVAYAHHGSLSRAIREDVETKLKAGELKAIVATNSLELGIDIGELSEVVLIQSPPSISAAVQRVGRAGHRIDAVSKATLYPTHAIDFLEAAVVAPAILNQDIESVTPVEAPLDVLAQVLISMVGMQTWDIDALFAKIKTSYPYRNLSRTQFDLVLNMLAGRYAESRIRELKPRVSIDRIDNTVAIKPGALLALYMGGGVIPDRGYFHLRHAQSGARIGELDEEFVWEASLGQIFTLGTQNWKIERITHNDVLVTPGNPKAMAIPFWRGESRDRDFHFSCRLADFLENANERIKNAAFISDLQKHHHLDETAAKTLTDFLKRQKEKSGTDLPHRHHLLIEHIQSGPKSAPGNQVVLHTLWGGRVNRPFGMALSAAWQKRFGQRLQVFSSNDCVAILLPHAESGATLLSLVTEANLMDLLREHLEGSGFFGARFRECAGRALLLSRRKMNERMPLWMNRLRSQKLLEAVSAWDDFPILLEAWRTCLHDAFDLDNLRKVLSDIGTGTITWSEVHTTAPSPMAQGLAWRQVNKYMYMGDESQGDKTSRLRADLLKDLVFAPQLRPSLKPALITEFEQKRQRLSPGYAPSSSQDLLDWIKERIALPAIEWNDLLRAIIRDHKISIETLVESIDKKLLTISPPGLDNGLVVATESLSRIAAGLYGGTKNLKIRALDGEPFDPTTVLPNQLLPDEKEETEALFTALTGQWLQYYGPVEADFIRRSLWLPGARVQSAIENLIETRQVISGVLIKSTKGQTKETICDSDNFEMLLRMTRVAARPAFEALEIKRLPLFLALYQGIVLPGEKIEACFERTEQLLGYPARAGLWESDIFPARVAPYHNGHIDRIMQETDLRWIGDSDKKISFCFTPDLDLLAAENSPAPEKETDIENIAELFPDPLGRYDFDTLINTGPLSPAKLSKKLWQAVWLGLVSNDTFLALRQGIIQKFAPVKTAADVSPRRAGRIRPAGRGGFNRWKQARKQAGNWFRIKLPEKSDDPLAIEERNRERVRLLLSRYGILFRELLKRESPAFRWAALFRSLRIMELSGEVLAGHFFEGIPGLQFMAPNAFNLLTRKLPEDKIFWLNAADPASLCGAGLSSLKKVLPPRLDRTYLVYKGSELVLIVKRYGKDLIFKTPVDDPDLALYFGPLHHLLSREFMPLSAIGVETINGQKAAESPYLDSIKIAFETVVAYNQVTLYRFQAQI
jgi:ATP-dependent helicase Lhr and Lhr-like helicase